MAACICSDLIDGYVDVAVWGDFIGRHVDVAVWGDFIGRYVDVAVWGDLIGRHVGAGGVRVYTVLVGTTGFCRWTSICEEHD